MVIRCDSLCVDDPAREFGLHRTFGREGEANVAEARQDRACAVLPAVGRRRCFGGGDGAERAYIRWRAERGWSAGTPGSEQHRKGARKAAQHFASLNDAGSYSLRHLFGAGLRIAKSPWLRCSIKNETFTLATPCAASPISGRQD